MSRILHGSAAGNTQGTGRSISPPAKSAVSKAATGFSRSELKEKKRGLLRIAHAGRDDQRLSTKCRTEGRGNKPSFGVAGTKAAEYWAQHAPDRTVNVCCRKCTTESCGKQPPFGVPGVKTAEYCAQHATGGMVNWYNRK